MSIHAERATHTENVDGLHGFHRQALRIEELLQLPPARAALDIHHPMLFIQANGIEVSQIEYQSSVSESLATHAVLLSRACDLRWLSRANCSALRISSSFETFTMP